MDDDTTRAKTLSLYVRGVFTHVWAFLGGSVPGWIIAGIGYKLDPNTAFWLWGLGPLLGFFWASFKAWEIQHHQARAASVIAEEWKAKAEARPIADLSLVLDPTDQRCIPGDGGEHTVQLKLFNKGNTRAERVRVRLEAVAPAIYGGAPNYLQHPAGNVPAGGLGVYVPLIRAQHSASTGFNNYLLVEPKNILLTQADIQLTLLIDYDGKAEPVVVDLERNARGALRPR